MPFRIILIISLLPIAIFAQKSASELLPAHSAELERYLTANKNLAFRQGYNLDDEYLKSVHEWFGKSFKPNYAVGDFNRNRIKDFAVLLYREGKCEPNEGITSEEHKEDYPLRLVVFNGIAKGFRVAIYEGLDGTGCRIY
jgi:alpha-ketoglutarate-dependent taurine dioxygenase